MSFKIPIPVLFLFIDYKHADFRFISLTEDIVFTRWIKSLVSFLDNF